MRSIPKWMTHVTLHTRTHTALLLFDAPALAPERVYLRTAISPPPPCPRGQMLNVGKTSKVDQHNKITAQKRTHDSLLTQKTSSDKWKLPWPKAAHLFHTIPIRPVLEVRHLLIRAAVISLVLDLRLILSARAGHGMKFGMFLHRFGGCYRFELSMPTAR